MSTEGLRELLSQLIDGWENEVVEFKRGRVGFSTSEIGKYFSALANEANLRDADSGWLIFGVEDGSRAVVGTGYRESADQLNALKQQILDDTEPRVTFTAIHELDHEEGRVLLFEVPAAPGGIPVAWKGHCYARAGESIAPLGFDKLDQIRAQQIGNDWTAGVVPEASVDDLDESALARAREGFAERYRNSVSREEINAWTVEQFLEQAKLTRRGRITRAALLLVGKNASSHLLSPLMAEMTWQLRGQEEAYEHFGLPFLTSASELYARIRNIQLRLLPPDELIYREISKYDQRSILEALYNCVAHQDYWKSSRILVTEYPDKLEFISVGEFYDGQPNDYVRAPRSPRHYRNPFLVEAMTHLNLIDHMGFGVRRLHQSQVERYLPLPDYDLSAGDEVKLTIPGAVLDERYTKLLMSRTDLPLDDVLALDRVQKGLEIPKATSDRLRRAKLIEGRRPNLHISAPVAAASDDVATYVRTRPQDDAFYARLITDYLKLRPATTRELSDMLWDKLSDGLDEKQKQYKVKNLLTKLRKQGAIRSVGSRPKARWELV